MKALYKFHVDCGRMGSLDGIFIAEDAEVQALAGKPVYFGEVLGKHSDVEVDLKAEHFQRITDDAVFVNSFETFKCQSGFDPRDYIHEEDDEQDDGED